MINIDVCLTPDTIHLYDIKGKIVVVADIFRATSTMVTALNSGVKEVIPVSKLEDCEKFSGDHIIKAAERGGKKVDDFQYGNSPFDFINNDVDDKTLVMTTTNGTVAINLSREADEVLIGSFLNLTSTLDYLREKGKDVVVFCAGWKGKFSLEDTLYAGAVAKEFYSKDTNSDSAFMALELYKNAEKIGLMEYVKNANHYRRLAGFNNQKDMEFIMQIDYYEGVGKLEGDKIVYSMQSQKVE